MREQPVSRRAFLGTAAAGLTLAAASRRTAGQAPSDRIGVGFIGVGNMGMSRLQGFMAHPDVRVAAVCDVDRTHRERAAAKALEVRNERPAVHADYRRVLDDREVDAVVIVTPDHWHAIPTVRAFEAGKDVFVEKPLSYTVAEGRAMADASARHERVSQMGNHIHNDRPTYRRVVELVRSGALGRITRVQIWRTSRITPLTTDRGPTVPDGLDYDMWLGPAPKRPYHPLRSHFTYRDFWDYSGGIFIDFWCHIVDVALWALDLPAPRSVSATGGRLFLTDETETPDTLEATLDYPGLVFTFSLRPTPLPGFEHIGPLGCLFEGTEASLVTNYDRHEVWVKGKRAEDFPRPDPSIPDSPGHIREFLDAVKARTLETTCNVRYGHRLTTPGLLANIAYRTGRRLYWDGSRERFVNDRDADRYLSRRGRRPYRL